LNYFMIYYHAKNFKVKVTVIPRNFLLFCPAYYAGGSRAF
jgi:hypothetical protein